MKKEDILVSFIVLDIKNHHLTFLTLDSILRQTEKRYEIIVMTTSSGLNFQTLREYKEKLTYLKHTRKKVCSGIMNEGVDLAKGKYLHFLFPGEVYLSKHSLEYVCRKIDKEPDLLCFSFLKREFSSNPEVKNVSFSVRLLGNERFPIFLRNSIFLKKKILELKKFDLKYESMESFDMISRIYLKKGKVICCRRVIVDYELQKKSSKEAIQNLLELFLVIKRNFGFHRLFHWYVIKEMFELLIWWVRGIKRYFVQAK